MWVKALVSFLLVFTLGINYEIFTSNIEADKKSLEKKVYDAKKIEESIIKLRIASNHFLTIYNRYAVDLDELISKDLLGNNFKESEYSKNIEYSNGQITFNVADTDLKNIYLSSNEKAIKSLRFKQNSKVIASQNKVLDSVNSTDTDLADTTNYKDTFNSRVTGALEEGNVSDLSTNTDSKFTEQQQNINNDLLNTIRGF